MFSATAEIDSPSPIAAVVKTIRPRYISQTCPFIGTWNQYRMIRKMIVDCKSPTKIDGSALPIRICTGRTGVSNRASRVPRSHSRAISNEVRKAPISVITRAIRLGTRNQVLSLASLSQVRVTTVIPLPVNRASKRSARCSKALEIAPFA